MDGDTISTFNNLVLLRGFPSCGKSYTAKRIVENFGEENTIVLSTDDYWYEINCPEKPEEYSFDIKKIAIAHKWNQKRAMKAMDDNVKIVVIDNTNITHKDVKFYVDYATKTGRYNIVTATPTSPQWKEIRPLLSYQTNDHKLKEWSEKLAEISKETHNVPAFAIKNMMDKWTEFTEFKEMVFE